MKIININKNDWEAGIDKSRKAYNLVGPVAEKGTHVFRELDENELPDMEYTSTKLSPKSVVFPQTEILFNYTLDPKSDNQGDLVIPEIDNSARAVIGIRPYDSKAIQLVKMNFDTAEYKDPYWLSAYERCTFIGLAVNKPEKNDFSTSCGTGPFDETGLDVLLADAGESYLAKVLTQKGETWLSVAGFTTEADGSAIGTLDKLKEVSENAVTSKASFDKIKEKEILEIFEADFWEDATFGCINCGTCTYSCPTCWCFDIQDETVGTEGARIRNWDSCMTGLFTLHGSGHNPRERKWERTRQRFMHKLKYFLDKYDEGIMCVGCGRCVTQCPANIDIREICETINSLGQ